MTTKAKKDGLTKREFLKAAGASALGVAGLAATAAHGREEYDVIVIGAGFAGVTAAREVSKAGLRTVILEARNRLGGRTFSSKFGDDPVELGGTWIHWGQPHVWAEVMRYGLSITETEGVGAPERVVWLADGEKVEKPSAEAMRLLVEATAKYCEPASRVLPRPFDPFFRDEFLPLDRFSSEDRLREINLPAQQRALVAALVNTLGHSPLRTSAWIEMLRCWSLSGNDLGRLTDITGRYRFRDGTISLINAMLADGKPELKLATPVSAIHQDARRVQVVTETGAEYAARSVIVTVPMNTLARIEFSPALDSRKVAASKERHAAAGTKVWIKVRGKLPPLQAIAPEPAPFSMLFTEKPGKDGQYLIGFSPSRQWLDPKDRAAVEKAVRQLLPNLEVEQVLNYDWDLDPYSLGTWCVFRPGQATKYWKELRRPEGRVYFASADSALGFRGFIDGAIESGLHTGYLVASSLRKRG